MVARLGQMKDVKILIDLNELKLREVAVVIKTNRKCEFITEDTSVVSGQLKYQISKKVPLTPSSPRTNWECHCVFTWVTSSITA